MRLTNKQLIWDEMTVTEISILISDLDNLPKKIFDLIINLLNENDKKFIIDFYSFRDKYKNINDITLSSKTNCDKEALLVIRYLLTLSIIGLDDLSF